MATEEEFNQDLDRLPDEDFKRIASQFGIEMAGADRDSFKQHFKHEGKFPRDKFCKIFGLPTETEKIASAGVRAADASKQSAAVAAEALEVSRASARAAQDSAEAEKTMARLAEESRCDAKASARHAAIATIIAALACIASLAQTVISLFSYTTPTQK